MVANTGRTDPAASAGPSRLAHGLPPRLPTGRGKLPEPDSIWWIAAVAAAFTGAQLLFFPLRLGLSWDEVVYVSQVSGHASAAFFDPARSRGIPLLVAPVAMLSASVAALRAYLAVASGLALFGALLAWRRLRPAWMLALAGIMFGGLWVTQYYGPQAMPDEWMAFAALAAVGLFLRAVGLPADNEATPRPSGQAAGVAAKPAPRWPLALLAAMIAAAALIRIGDAVFLAAILLIAALTVRSWRRWPVLIAVGAGFAAGSAEWVAEAYLRFGGPLRRLHLASAEQGGFGLHPGAWAELRALNGPTLCRPCTIGWRLPVLSLWWLALPVLVVLGVLAARQAGRLGSALLAAACAFVLAAQYLFGIDYAAPRFLLPAYALAVIPVADLLGWLLTGIAPARRPLATAVVAAALTVQLVSQNLVLDHEAAATVTFHQEYVRATADLRRAGIRPPCLINGAQRIPIAFYAGCASAPDWLRRPLLSTLRGRGGTYPRFAVLVWVHSRPPRYARTWRRLRLAGTMNPRLVAYLPPG